MFTFALSDVHAVIARGRSDAAANGGYRNPHYGFCPGKDEQPGLWLVGDEGVYLLSNGRLAEGQRALVIYAEECDPRTNPDYWDYKRRYFGGDDGIEFLDAAALERLIAAASGATHLAIATTETSLSVTPIRR